MKWVSIDIGRLMGVTHWIDDQFQKTLIVKPMGGKGRYYYGDKVVVSKRSAILHMLKDCEFVVMEQGMGSLANVVNAQGKQRGYIEAVCDEFNMPKPREVKPSEWRRPIKELLQVSWPKKSEDQKKLAQKVVHSLLGIHVSEDEADSICVGWSALKLGYVDISKKLNNQYK
jgi:hypothetical protein